jgi:hypothetical protein
MQMAIGIRRAIMQDERRAPFRFFPQRLIEVHILPAGQNFRLFFRQTGPHGETLFWVKRVLRNNRGRVDPVQT